MTEGASSTAATARQLKTINPATENWSGRSKDNQGTRK